MFMWSWSWTSGLDYTTRVQYEVHFFDSNGEAQKCIREIGSCSDLEIRMDRVRKIFVRGRERVCLLCGCRKKFELA